METQRPYSGFRGGLSGPCVGGSGAGATGTGQEGMPRTPPAGRRGAVAAREYQEAGDFGTMAAAQVGEQGIVARMTGSPPRPRAGGREAQKGWERRGFRPGSR
jgi:hypothetical protein